MHDCREMQDNLMDVIFDEADGAARSRLSAEVERCPACAAEYRSFAATLDACGEAANALAPAASYWPEYHAALTRRLRDAAAGEAQPARASSGVAWWKRLLTTSIRVPAPLAAAAALLLAVMSVFALTLVARRAPEPVVLAAPGAGSATPEVAPQIKFIEVPVVREKIVTQIIYLPRRDGGDAQGNATHENLAGVGRRNAPSAPAANATADTATARPNLSDFKPTGDVNLRIIKGGDAREQ
jgi:anti-sigma factor RsiW